MPKKKLVITNKDFADYDTIIVKDEEGKVIQKYNRDLEYKINLENILRKDL